MLNQGWVLLHLTFQLSWGPLPLQKLWVCFLYKHHKLFTVPVVWTKNIVKWLEYTRFVCSWDIVIFSGIAGGLTNLSKMPACNVLVLGSQKKTLSGFSTTAILPHTGYIYYCDIVQKTPPVSVAMAYYLQHFSIVIRTTFASFITLTWVFPWSQLQEILLFGFVTWSLIVHSNKCRFLGSLL